MSTIAADHVRHVHRVVAGRPDGVANADRITQSWLRCHNEYGLYPDSCEGPVILGHAELQEREHRLADVQEVARIEMANLYQQLAGSGYAIMLTDSDGVLLNFFGDPGFTHAASKSGLMQGAVWSERLQGTNGMGTCLIEKKPFIVHGDEHYLVRNIGISCAAAPICNHLGDVIAVLDASGESRLAQQHTLALVNMSVQMIENRVFLHQFRRDYILRFHHRAEFVGTLSEGAIAFSAAGAVLAATRCAQALLGFQTPAGLCGRDIGELFNVSFTGLLDSSVKKAFHPVPIFEVRRGARFFAVIYPPEPAPPLYSVTAGNRTPLDELQFGDAAMAGNIRTAKRVLERDIAIILCGETGTGKELFARAVHRSGSRAQKPFIAINCAAIPEALIESELFGYRPGAFTGASKEGQRGKIFQANGGTLFLDEIGDMPLFLQTRLLRVLEEREVLALGSDAPVKLDIRLISATHCDLKKKIAQNEFREDLYYRLQGVTLVLPPLRERADRRELILHVLASEAGGENRVDIDAALLDALQQHPWPGNIRQLRHLLRTMLALRESERLTLDELPPDFAPRALPCAVGAAPKLNSLENAERDALTGELEKHGWNITILAKQLKMSRNTLYRKMRRLDIHGQGRTALH